LNLLEDKIVDSGSLPEKLDTLERPIVFTNGCFDILHRGHVTYLQQAAGLGNSLVIGVNTDASVHKLSKGKERPLNPLADRTAVLAALEAVDLVVAFDEDTPLELIRQIRPDHLVKGGDWTLDSIVGADQVRSWGGKVHSIPFKYQRSTTRLVKRIRSGG
jgi:rfaE bifunctional protein nucleotidyltransferase chain/domain